ncbi:MAG: 6-phospho-beta-glucosidase [Firmicutes bacterium]|nr:6-phospho-beta-glucosidase [Bacillota bacterium]
MKIAIIGAGSTYTPELIDGFIKRHSSFSVKELSFMDIDPGRLGILSEFSKKMIKKAGVSINISATTVLEEAIKEASFIISQIRVGGQSARVFDEKIALESEVIAQETTGAGGFSCALRTIPVMLEIGKKVKEISPSAWLINFTNPSGIITEALLQKTGIKAAGLCNVPLVMERHFAGLLDIKGKLELDYAGLNHLSWVVDAFHNRKSVMEELLKKGDELLRLKKDEESLIKESTIDAIGIIPSPYLRYFYYEKKILEEQKNVPLRAEKVKEIENNLLKEYSKKNFKNLPELLMERGGSLYSESAINVIKALVSEKESIQIVNYSQQGAFNDMKKENVMELPFKISSRGISPSYKGRVLPQFAAVLIKRIKMFEEFTIEAALTGSREKAINALKIHPLVGNSVKAEEILNKILEVHKQYLPAFK